MLQGTTSGANVDFTYLPMCTDTIMLFLSIPTYEYKKKMWIYTKSISNWLHPNKIKEELQEANDFNVNDFMSNL